MNKFTFLILLCCLILNLNGLEGWTELDFHNKNHSTEKTLLHMYKDLNSIYESMNRKQVRLEEKLVKLELDLKSARISLEKKLENLEYKIDCLLTKLNNKPSLALIKE